jgi:protein TonB
VTPENPIPRRLYAGPLEYPADYAPFRYQAAVEVQVVLDAAGVPMRVEAGATALTVALAGAPQEPDRRIVMDAFRTAAVDAVKQWRYDAPVQAPLLFWVEISFRSGEPVRVSQNSVSRGVWATRDAVGFGAMAPPPPPVATARFRPEVVYDAAGNRREVPVSVYAAADAQVNAQIAEIAALQEQLKVLRTRQADVLAQLPKERPSDLGQPARSSDLVVDRIKELEMQLVAARRAVDGSLTLSGRTPVRVDGDRVKAPTKLKNVPPAYPAIAMSARVQGTVVLEVLVDEQGHVADARVLRSIPLLDAAAIEAVRQWEFTPTLLDGSPQPIFMTVTVQFSLN